VPPLREHLCIQIALFILLLRHRQVWRAQLLLHSSQRRLLYLA
jgi:hypothetical protein